MYRIVDKEVVCCALKVLQVRDIFISESSLECLFQRLIVEPQFSNAQVLTYADNFIATASS